MRDLQETSLSVEFTAYSEWAVLIREGSLHWETVEFYNFGREKTGSKMHVVKFKLYPLSFPLPFHYFWRTKPEWHEVKKPVPTP